MNANSSLRVLLIGATGYIGSSVARALDAAGHTVIPLIRTAFHGTVAEPGNRDTVVGDCSSNSRVPSDGPRTQVPLT